ncbi:MAG: hypothetical protein JO343_04780 [Candidatus Eremiobacteraeota bacterium]|nr:hypothetical protein [Candidatus Eremiobacteraeota bacterium]MBV8339238.1 hypothetical protein [Candidatus Eremiobacteraeota bacterium]MBV8595830.1 hypothetical protein [Candidatus Eremiobacteraeota bacterium]
MTRIRHQFFLMTLMVAFTAASSAIAPLTFGYQLRDRARRQRLRIARRTRRRFARARGAVKRRTRPVLALLARSRSAA